MYVLILSKQDFSETLALTNQNTDNHFRHVCYIYIYHLSDKKLG